MKCLRSLLLLAMAVVLVASTARGEEHNVVCYYDSASYLRPGFAKFSIVDLELALPLCTHLVYGYAGLNPNTREIRSLNVDLDMFHYAEITLLKNRFRHLKVLLSVGGDHDVDPEHPTKYIDLLESGRTGQQNFIDSSISLLRRNGFDGLDLAFQLPRNKARKVHSTVGMVWKKFKKLFTGDFIVDEKAEEHKRQYTDFVIGMKTVYARSNLSLTMTVLPNVNSSWYFDVPQIKNSFDMINLAGFDFLTPERNPEEADFSAPIYAVTEQNRLPFLNIEYQVNYWLDNHCPRSKINVGVASYGRAWKMTADSGVAGLPVVQYTDGPAEPGALTNVSGLLSWPEICAMLPNKINAEYRGATAPLRKVSDLEQRYGNYALRPADENGEFGLWVSYDDPDFIGIKASYTKTKGLGGMALYDLSYDDFRGLCTGLKFPILRSIKYYL